MTNASRSFKKFYFSLAVVFSFVFYAIYQRHNSGQFAASSFPQNGQAAVSTPISTPVTTPSEQGARQGGQQPLADSSKSSASVNTNYYADGQFTGSVANVYYGNVQVMVTVSNGKISNVQFLQHPMDRMTSMYINSRAMPILTSEAIQAQNANVNIVSGATDTSYGFMQSLSSALDQSHLSAMST